ncbi:DUF1007 family protein [Bradyrhizobium sp. KBS0727]|nr:DUF1007 family protein [Bradyrhizobium sp. KBS0725]QDW43152.1 DUF1007 family protein [Bradyrhizobium sp. KBS0727]
MTGKAGFSLPQKSAIGRLLCLLLVATAGLALGLSSAKAHPHVWITAKSRVIYAPDGSVSGVRHAWTFDDMFSTYALQGIEQKTKGAYSREELAPLAQTNVESLKEFGFFTFARADGSKQRFLEPVDYFLEFKDSLLSLHFTLPAKTPFKAKQLVLEVFDRAFFIDFKYADQDPVTLVGAPAACRMQFQRPNDGSAAAQKLGEQDFAGGEGGNFGLMFANKITVDCP